MTTGAAAAMELPHTHDADNLAPTGKKVSGD